MGNSVTILHVKAEVQRVSGFLMESPEYYLMAVNGLLVACNQKSARNPVVQYDEETISLTIHSLRKKGLVATVRGGGSRAVKYKHQLAAAFPCGARRVGGELSVFIR